MTSDICRCGWMYDERPGGSGRCPRCAGESAGTRLDVTKVGPGDRVVFAQPGAGRPSCVRVAAESGLEVGRAYSVVKVDLGAFSCMLRLAGMGCWFNAVQFEEAG